MDILIDTNVVINFLTDREDPYKAESVRIMELCARENVRGYIAFHCLPTIWYVLRKNHSPEKTRYLLQKACKIVSVVSASHEQVLEAVKNESFKDFEDCLQDKCAQNAGADYIVTCNIRDFRNSTVRAVTPLEMLKIAGY